MSPAADWPLLAARFALLALGIGLFGESCFGLYAPWVRRGNGPATLRAAAPLAASVAGLVWIVALGREAAGAPGLPDAAVLARLCAETGFGRALTAAVALGLALAVLALAPRRLPPQVPAILSGGLLASLAFVGHAAAVGGMPGAVRIAVMAAHLLFAGVWLGGLLPLARALRSAGAEPERLLRVFGGVAIGAAAALATTGLIIAAAVLSLAEGPPGRSYLTTLGVKLALVAGLLAVAGVNRWTLTPLAAREPARAARALRWTLAFEQLLALALIAAVARLGLLDPGM